MPNVVVYRRANGSEPYMEFLEQVTRAGRKASLARIKATVDVLGEFGAQALATTGRAEYLDGGIWELRTHSYRVMFFHDEWRNNFVLLQGFIKQTQRTPQREMENAKRLRDGYFEQHGQGR
jgi:phage-related protein